MFGSFSDSPLSNEQKAVITPAPKATEEEVIEKEQIPATESAPEESTVEDTAPTDTTQDSDSEDEKSDSEDSNTQEDKPRKGFQKRVDRLNSKIQQREQEIEYWKKVALERQNGQPSAPQQVTQTQGKPVFSDYNDIDAYTDALTDWKLENKFREQNNQNKVQQISNDYDRKLEEFKKTTPDFDEVFQEFIEDYGHINVPEMVELALTSDVGPQITHYLATHPEEFVRISKLSPIRRASELGKVEARLSTKETPVETKKTTKAPPPIETVKGSGKVETANLQTVTDYQEFLKMRNKQLKARR